MNTNNDKKLLENYLDNALQIGLIGPMAIDEGEVEQTSRRLNLKLICVDGGLLNTKINYLSVGDGDSAQRECDINFPENKDFTDLEGTLQLLPSQVELVHAFGFLGGRLDHQLVVLQNFFNFAHQANCQIHLHGQEKIDIFPPGEHLVTTNEKFSLLSMQDATISITGACLYQVKSSPLIALSGLGLSNQGSGEFKISCNQPFSIFYFSE